MGETNHWSTHLQRTEHNFDIEKYEKIMKYFEMEE